MTGPVFDPGADRSTTRGEYSTGRRIARVVGMLISECGRFDRAADDAAIAVAAFSNRLLLFGHPEYVERFLAAARARSKTTTRSAESYLSEIGSRIAAGDDPDQVLQDFTVDNPEGNSP